MSFTVHSRTLALVLLSGLWLPLSTAADDTEVEQWLQLPLSVSKSTLERVFAAPAIRTADGFTSDILVPPRRQLFDPFDLYLKADNTLLVADDAKSGAIYVVALDGSVTTLARIEQHAPISIDVAPASFGSYAGHIYTVAFAKPEKAGGWELPDAITRIDPSTGQDTVVCFLPDNEQNEPGAGGFFARFGPEGSPFAGKLWVTAASNHTLYQVTPDGTCTAFAIIDLEKWGSPRGISFTPDGNTMLLGSARPDTANRAKTTPGGGRILRMSASGAISEQVFVGGLHEPGAMAYAPAGFGTYGGQLFVSDAGDWNNEAVATEPVDNDGRLYRVTADGQLVLVASGFANPVGVAFIDNTLVVSDINGDFHVGTQKFADGFMVVIEPQ